MNSEAILFVEHDDDLEVSDKAHCGSCTPEVTDTAHCGSCTPQSRVEVTDKAHCGDCF
ncbi:MAG: hypothetical protein AMXMBFR34_48590 [Myxococcaceae bacterium]